jgi:pilus assembly protein CpaB
MARRIILVLIALLVSGGAIFLGQQWLRGSAGRSVASRPGAAAPTPGTQVLVAKTNLFSGQFIRPDSLGWQAWPSGSLPESYLVQGKVRPQDLVGAVVRARIAQGQPVTLASVVRPGDRGFMAAVLTPGQRAVTVNVNAATGNAGFIFPGDRVDLLLTMSLQPVGQNNNGVTRHVSETILRDVRIVGMDQSFTDGRKDDKADLSVPRTATLEVTPKQAEIVSVAGDLGVLSMALRSVATTQEASAGRRVTKTWDTEATQLAVAAQSSQAATPAAPRVWTVNIVRGASASEAPLPAAAPSERTMSK